MCLQCDPEEARTQRAQNRPTAIPGHAGQIGPPEQRGPNERDVLSILTVSLNLDAGRKQTLP